MTAPTAIFTCSICSEPSTDICVYCTKDACANHRCHRCKRCSDCCECEVPLSAAEVQAEQAVVAEPAVVGEDTPDTPEIAPAVEIEETHGEGTLP